MKEIMKWELKNLLRFPILEIIIVFAVFQIAFVGNIFEFLVAGHGDILTVNAFHGEIGRVTYEMLTNNFIQSRIIIYLIASLLFTISFAYELDTNLTKIYLSYPVKRRDYFIVKFMACFVILFVMFLCAGIGFAGFVDPVYFSVTLMSSYIWAYALLLFLLIFFASTFSVTIAIFSKNTAISFIGSFFTLYIFDSAAANIPLSPPSFLRNLADHFFTGHSVWRSGGEVVAHYLDYAAVMKIIYYPLFFSILLLLISFFYYTRYFEVR
jgi:ABC-type transport system involved in multi-copper enzyme maturation permease subunit